MRRALLYVGGWLLAVVLATGVGFAAVSLVGDDVGAPGDTVALVATPVASETASPDTTTEPGDDGDGKSGAGDTGGSSGGGSAGTTSRPVTQVTDSGTVTGVCRSGSPRLVSYAPKNGWSVVDVDGTGTRRAVVFSDETTYVTVALRCGARGPVFTVGSASASPTPEPTGTPTATPTETPSVDPGNGNG